MGKTTIVRRVLGEPFSLQQSSRCGYDKHEVCVKVDDSVVTLELDDISGQAKYNSVTELQFREADAIVMVFDVTREKSYKEMLSVSA